MAITFFASTSAPADNGAQDNSVARSVTPPGSMAAGDLVIVTVNHRSGSATISNSGTGGQTWTPEAQVAVSGSGQMRRFWCRFNGTWDADPQFDTSSHTGIAITLEMVVFRPTSASNTWASDVAQTNSSTTPATPFDVVATGQVAIADSTVTVVSFATCQANTWALQTGGWANPDSITQRRNTTGTDISLSTGYLIQTSPGATGNVTNRQATLGGSDTRWIIQTFKEVSPSGVFLSRPLSGGFQEF